MKQSFFARNSVTILVAAMFLMPFAFLGARRAFLTNQNDVQQWLPDRYDETATFRWFQKHFAGEQFVLASWEGCTFDDQRIELLAEKLVPADRSYLDATTSLFDEVLTGPQALERLMQPPSNLSRDEALKRLRGTLVGPNLEQTCVVFTLSELGKETPRKAVNAVRNVASQECNIPLSKLHLGGPPVDNTAIDEAGENSLIRLASLALGIGLVISWWCLRSVRLVLLVFIAGLYSAALSLAIVWYVGYAFYGITMNAILLTMPSLVYVAAVSGAIHLSNYYRDTAVEEGVRGAAGRAVKHAAVPLGLATSTTVIGLLTLVYSELVPIQLFGLFSGAGVAASLLVLCLFLPACFELFPMRVTTADRVHLHEVAVADGRPGNTWWWRIAEWIVDHSGIVTAAGIAVLVIGAIGMTQMQTSVQLMRMFPKRAKILADYRWLEENLGDLVPMEIVIKMDRDPAKCPLTFVQRLELVERIQERVESIADVGSALSAVTFAPGMPKPEDYRSGGGISGGLSGLLGSKEFKLRTARRITNERLERSREDFIAAGWLAEENGCELWRVSARVGALKDVDYHVFLAAIRDEVDHIFAEAPPGHWKLDRNGDLPGGITVWPAGIETIYTGLVPLIYKAQRSLLDGLLWGFVMDLITVTIVMMLCVREWSAGLVLMLPSVFPVFVVFGVMGWMGTIVDTGTVMAPAVALGVTVDDVVHFMLMYRGALKRGLSRREAIMVSYQGCARAMYQSWGVIGLGMSVFALSPFTPTQRFGYMMVTLLTSALIGNLIVLPAVLASPLGGLFGKQFFASRRRPAPVEVARPRVAIPAAHSRRHEPALSIESTGST
ncbi:MAG TPA: MMPL family transporter [Pirellulales bacterium]|nr:MMPL family transporter [Pirellulales bacterium]